MYGINEGKRTDARPGLEFSSKTLTHKIEHVVINSAFEHLNKLNGLISEKYLAQRNVSDGNVKIIEDGGIDVQQLGAMIHSR